MKRALVAARVAARPAALVAARAIPGALRGISSKFVAVPLSSAPLRAFAAAASLPPHTKVAMPALSPTMTAGTIIEWNKKPGDALNPGDLIASVGTDKATVDFECQDSGYLAKVLVPAGSADVAVGRIIAIMVETREAVDAFASLPAEALVGDAAPAAAAPAPAAAAPAPSAPKAPAPAPAAVSASAPASSSAASASASAGGRVVASPLAKKLAADAGVAAAALTGLAGTGPGGRIIAADVKEALAQGRIGAGAAAAAAAHAPAAAAAAAHAAAAAAVGGAGAGAPSGAAGAGVPARGAYVDVPHSAMRRVIAQRLTASKQCVPHYTLTGDVALDAVLALRASLNADLPATAAKLSLNDFIIKASALACRKVPEMNSSWLDEAGVIRSYSYVDVSVAVATDGGLITPIVTDADTKGLAAIASSVKSLAEKARSKSLRPEEYQGGTFTISNLGMFGVKSFAAIINPPQAGILAVGAAERRVVPDTSAAAAAAAAGAGAGAAPAFKQATFMSATLSCDHRVVDGAVGAQWLAAFKGFLEAPHTMLL